MPEITLLPGFNLSKNKIEQLAFESKIRGQVIDIIIPIAGQLYLTDSEDLAVQFLTAAYIGQQLFETCIEIECYLPSSIDAHESTGFELIPKDAKLFVERLWEVIPPFMSEDLLAESEYDELTCYEIGLAGWDLLDVPNSELHFPELVNHAKAILEVGNNDDEND